MAQTATNEKPKGNAPLTSAFFSGLSADDDDAKISTSRADKLEGTPLRQWVRESRERGKAKRLVIPTSAVDEMKRLVRLAAKKEGCGVAFETHAAADNPDNTTFRFKAGAKREYNPPKKIACPGCKRDIAVRAKDGALVKHNTQPGRGKGKPCRLSEKMPDGSAPAAK